MTETITIKNPRTNPGAWYVKEKFLIIVGVLCNLRMVFTKPIYYHQNYFSVIF